MLPFPTLGSISECYAYDKYDDFIEGGKFGTVFRAQAIEDRTTTQLRSSARPQNGVADRVLTAGSFVALKQIAKQTLVSDKDFKDVVNEVEVLRQLNHRNCLMFHEAFQTSTTVVIVMELIDEGEELMQALKSLCDSSTVGPSGQVVSTQSKTREEWSIIIMRQLLEGIRYLHRDRRIVHRDMKPENILVCPDPSHEDGIRVVIVDYGLAKYIGRSPTSSPGGHVSAFAAANNAASSSRPRANLMVRQRSETILHRCDSVDSVDQCSSPVLSTPCGTMKFTAPETVRGILEKGPEPRATTRRDILALDMFSIGIILFAMLTGKLPFPGSNQVEQARQMEAGPVYDNKDWATISDSARDFVWRLLNPNPHDRICVSEAQNHAWAARPSRSPSLAGQVSSSNALGASFTRSAHASPTATITTTDVTSTMAELQGIYNMYDNPTITPMGSRRSTDLAETEEPRMPPRSLTRSSGPAINVASVDDLYGQLQLAQSREGREEIPTPVDMEEDEEDEAFTTSSMRGGRCHSVPFGRPALITSANPYFGFACEE